VEIDSAVGGTGEVLFLGFMAYFLIGGMMGILGVACRKVGIL